MYRNPGLGLTEPGHFSFNTGPGRARSQNKTVWPGRVRKYRFGPISIIIGRYDNGHNINTYILSLIMIQHF